MSEIEFKIEEISDLFTRHMGNITKMVSKGLESGAVYVRLGREKRTNEQNAKQWPMLQDICRHLPKWPRADGTMCDMTPEKYKDMLTASLFGTEFCLNANQSGVVAFGVKTSKMNKEIFSQLIEFYYAFGTEKGVQWSEKALEIYDQYKEAKQ